jgi:hypothetical protein
VVEADGLVCWLEMRDWGWGERGYHVAESNDGVASGDGIGGPLHDGDQKEQMFLTVLRCGGG